MEEHDKSDQKEGHNHHYDRNSISFMVDRK